MEKIDGHIHDLQILVGFHGVAWSVGRFRCAHWFGCVIRTKNRKWLSD